MDQDLPLMSAEDLAHLLGMEGIEGGPPGVGLEGIEGVPPGLGLDSLGDLPAGLGAGDLPTSTPAHPGPRPRTHLER